MRTVTTLAATLACFSAVSAQSATLIISEVMEGSSWNKAVEIYNPTQSAVNLDDYKLGKTHNGGTTIENNATFSNGTVLLSGATWTMCHTSIAGTYQPQCDEFMSYISHNGNDVYFLIHIATDTVIDVFGDLTPNAPSAFTLCGSTLANEVTLVRKDSVYFGFPNWAQQIGTSQADCQWLVLPQNDFSNGGIHQCTFPTADLFISEVMEGSSFNKAVEIYNPTTAAVNLDGYKLGKTHNGGDTIENNMTFTSGTMLQPGATWTICSNQIASNYALQCNQQESYISHNGNDAYLLIRTSDDMVIDTFGELGPDPGSGGWTVCGVSGATVDNTLIRKNVIVHGNTNWTSQSASNTQSCEWLIRPQNDFVNGGTHNCTRPFVVTTTTAPTTPAPTSPSGAPTPFPQAQASTASLFFSEIMEGSSFNKAVEIYNPTAFSIALDGYKLGKTHNGGDSIENNATFTSGVVLGSGQTWTLCHTSISSAYAPRCNQMTSYISHNGNDVYFLVRIADDTVIDIFGNLVANPLPAFVLCGQATAADSTLIRKPTVWRGNPNWSQQAGTDIADCEWEIHPQNDFANGGHHLSVLPLTQTTCQPGFGLMASASVTDAEKIAIYAGQNGQGAKIIATSGTTVRMFNLATSGSTLTAAGTITMPSGASSAASIDVSGNVLAVAVDMGSTTAGIVQTYDLTQSTPTLLGSVTVGSEPDQVVFTPDGTKMLVSNTAQPNDAYTVDPVGSVSIVDVTNPRAPTVTNTVDFSGFTRAQMATAGVRVIFHNATVAQDMEPEFLAISPDGTTAWVALQTNNAIAIIDIASATVTNIFGAGIQNWNYTPVDPSNQDGGYHTVTGNVMSYKQPDSLVPFTVNGQLYYAAANEGDARDYGGWSEEARVSDLTLNPANYPDASTFQLDANWGRLKVTTANGDTDGNGQYEQVYGYGGRSFTIWRASDMTAVYDSANQTTQLYGSVLRSHWADARADDKGSEPESVVMGEINGNPILFVAMERTSDILMYDVSNPELPVYINNIYTGRMVSPEGMAFVPASQSSTGNPMLVVAYESSGDVAVYQATTTSTCSPPPPPPTFTPTVAAQCTPTVTLKSSMSASEAEKMAYYPAGNTLIATSQDTIVMYTIDASGMLTQSGTLQMPAGAASAASIDVNGNVLAVAIDMGSTVAGTLRTYDLSQPGTPLLGSIVVGSEPDQVLFTPDGTKMLVSNTAQPNDAYTVDPVGTISIVDCTNPASLTVSGTVDFSGFTQADMLARGVRVIFPNATVAQDMEPEFLAISPDGTTAWVALQTNNAIAVIDIASATVTDIFGAGIQNWNYTPVDPSNEDGGYNLKTGNAMSYKQPDSLAPFTVDGQLYYAAANEGDARDYDGWTEEARCDDLNLNPANYPNAADFQLDENWGRLKVTTANGDTNNNGQYEQVYGYGGRSFTIWRASDRTAVYDSANETSQLYGTVLASHWADGRADDKGPEPETIVTGMFNTMPVIFVAMERTSDILMYDVSNPMAPAYLGNVYTGTLSSPEGMSFVSAAQSPTGNALLLVAYEDSGNVAVYEFTNTNACQAGTTPPNNTGSSSSDSDDNSTTVIVAVVVVLAVVLAVIVGAVMYKKSSGSSSSGPSSRSAGTDNPVYLPGDSYDAEKADPSYMDVNGE